MKAKSSTRAGRFTMPTERARQFSTEGKRVMGLCIVVRAEQLFHSDVIEYIAIRRNFNKRGEA